jgi:[acyl-carrier-protein] S-malonyltransferase
MGIDLREQSLSAQALFEMADRLTGQQISRLCAEGPLERLTQTEIAQPAVVVTSLAALAVLRERLHVTPAAVAGHSLGELAAYVAAGVLEPEAALRLVQVRAQAMAEACAAVGGSMAAVIGLDEAVVGAICTAASEADSAVEVANLNSPGQVVISGARDAIDRVREFVKARGGRVLPLNVSGPFHSVYMRPAAERLTQALQETEFRAASVPVVLNSTAEATQEPDELRRELEVQLYSPVRWVETVQRLAELGCDRFLEVGPGQVLTGLVRRILPQATIANFGAMRDLDQLRSLLQVAVG